MRKVLQEILEKNPRFHHLTPLKTKHIAHWCRCHGYTPPDPESLRPDGDSIEDVLTQIDSEPGEQIEHPYSPLAMWSPRPPVPAAPCCSRGEEPATDNGPFAYLLPYVPCLHLHC